MAGNCEFIYEFIARNKKREWKMIKKRIEWKSNKNYGPSGKKLGSIGSTTELIEYKNDSSQINKISECLVSN